MRFNTGLYDIDNRTYTYKMDPTDPFYMCMCDLYVFYRVMRPKFVRSISAFYCAFAKVISTVL